MPCNTTRIAMTVITFSCNGRLGNADIFNASATDLAKESRTVYTGNSEILHTKEITVKLSSKRAMCISSNGRMRRSTKVNIVLEHIFAREVCRVDCIQLGLILDKLIVFGRYARCSARIVRRCCPTITDMGIAAVGVGRARRCGCCIHIDNRTGPPCTCLHIFRIEETDMRTVHLDRIRLDGAHIDNIGLQCGSIVERRCPTRLKGGFYSICDSVLRGDMKMPDVDLGILAEDHAVRVDDVDVVAALDLTVDIRGVRTRDDIQIVMCRRACRHTTIILNSFTFIDGVVAPVDNIVRRCGCNLRRVRRIAVDIDPRRIVMLARRASISDLWNQKNTRHACDKGIAHPLR